MIRLLSRGFESSYLVVGHQRFILGGQALGNELLSVGFLLLGVLQLSVLTAGFWCLCWRVRLTLLERGGFRPAYLGGCVLDGLDVPFGVLEEFQWSHVFQPAGGGVEHQGDVGVGDGRFPLVPQLVQDAVEGFRFLVVQY